MKYLGLLSLILSFALSLPAYARKPQYLQAKVLSTSTHLEYRDCEWKVPCPKTRAVISTPDGTKLSIQGAGWNGEHKDLLHKGDTITIEYYRQIGVWVVTPEKRYIFKIVDEEQPGQ